MRNTLLPIVVAALLPATSTVSAEQPRHQPRDKPAVSGKLLPIKGTGTGNSCAAFGPGFVKVAGTETCVKIGGAVGIGVGGSSGGR